MRRKARIVKIGNVLIGGTNPIAIQSMTKTDTTDVKSTLAQIKRLEKHSCQLVRVAVPDKNAIEALPEIKKQISIPLIADIHFNYRLAILALDAGADKVRINPANIGGKENVEKIIIKAKEKDAAIRIGVNAGSFKKREKNLAQQMVDEVLKYIELIEKLKFKNLVISLKSSDVQTTIQSYQLLAKLTDYPFHIGITEAGPGIDGIIKSAIGIGILLSEGLGDTLRVSLTNSPEKEVEIGYKILKTLNLVSHGPEIISCPTCGRCKIDLINLVKKIEKQINITPSLRSKPIKIAIMGCIVNGPGEAREADVGIAAEKGRGVIFRKGKIIKSVSEDQLENTLIQEIKKI